MSIMDHSKIPEHDNNIPPGDRFYNVFKKEMDAAQPTPTETWPLELIQLHNIVKDYNIGFIVDKNKIPNFKDEIQVLPINEYYLADIDFTYDGALLDYVLTEVLRDILQTSAFNINTSLQKLNDNEQAKIFDALKFIDISKVSIELKMNRIEEDRVWKNFHLMYDGLDIYIASIETAAGLNLSSCERSKYYYELLLILFCKYLHNLCNLTQDATI